MSEDNIEALAVALRQFAQDRDWDPFHSPKNLASALIVEAGELLEHFQWSDRGAREDLTARQLEAVTLEMADVFLYLIRLADKLDVDLIAAARRKLEVNALKYPVSLARGSSKKYTDL
ncbi:MAG TPA: nucleotide pyrophosphohydrolase [Steroidobacteraceae bacterium]|nr:nucleotide pyrophosphohydrolase [Steroidobacteraceae bacterium]